MELEGGFTITFELKDVIKLYCIHITIFFFEICIIEMVPRSTGAYGQVQESHLEHNDFSRYFHFKFKFLSITIHKQKTMPINNLLWNLKLS